MDKLIEMDSMTYKYPNYVFNHIDSVREKNANDYEKSYFELIKIIVSDKKGIKFTSDTTINRIVEVFSKNPRHFPQNYLRALMYQGIIRFQSGISDNKAYEPIKKALSLSEEADESEALNMRDTQIAYYYLGLIHNKNNNVTQSHEYFKQALFIAETLNDSAVLFKTYRDMYWNRMKALDFFTAKSILQELQVFPVYSEEQIRDIRNAEAAFYNSEKRYRNALKLDYQLLSSDKSKNDSHALVADYFRISDNYKYLNKLDSALYYGELAAKNIVDTAFYLNYYYYLNVAEIAAKMNNFKKSSEAYSQVYSLMNKAITQQLNTQILELEKKYDASESERKAIRLKSDNVWLQFSIMMLAFVFILITLIYRNKARIRKENEKLILKENKILEQQKMLVEERAKQAALDKKLAERKLVEKQFVIPIYRQISQRNLDIKNFLMDLKSHGYISKNPQLLERIENEYKNYIQTTKISETQFLSDELFADLTGIKVNESQLFNESEKLMMAFLATGADNQQMATLLNTSVESIRVRKSKLKKKMEENGVKIPENLEKEMD
ncbi:hypothetical protein TRIP_D300155 [uncultured Paludibacter sp.]|nr:hypothetical protein TRIP_D300155 [uncultured Paludibacter sp.]